MKYLCATLAGTAVALVGAVVAPMVINGDFDLTPVEVLDDLTDDPRVTAALLAIGATAGLAGAVVS